MSPDSERKETIIEVWSFPNDKDIEIRAWFRVNGCRFSMALGHEIQSFNSYS